MAETLDDFYGTDILFDADLIRQGGDLERTAGLENLKKSLLRRLVTEPGSIIHRPTYGVGLKRFQNAPNTMATKRALALRIDDQFRQDPRVVKVLGVTVDSPKGQPDVVLIVVRVQAQGYGETQISFQGET